ncbi:hypothetical protein PoB_005704100 [Plakobranchus ocellatus]|uniref:Ricin B lectin domain-containing protein n=1 Tax=Plakobranchus ocellatus TaxID=259542 RepID=A0AAV4C5E9_9GAST|nr:hypothetical protein PoB_005704100 [Plakobranchus ocellatus]
MYRDNESGPLQECRSRFAKRVEIDHCRKVYRDVTKSGSGQCRNVDRHVARELKLTTAEMWIEMYQDNRNGLQQICRSRCAKTVEVDHCRNLDRDVPRQWKWSTAEWSIEMYQDSRSGQLQKSLSKCTKTVEMEHCKNADRDVLRQWKQSTAEM